MSAIVATFGIIMFGAMVLATKYHFRGDQISTRMKLISAISLTGFTIFLYGISYREPSAERAAVSTFLFLSALSLFLWAIISTRQTRLYLAFSSLVPKNVVRGGPYAYMRHPFYVSYVLFWTGCATATFDAASLVTLFILATLYYRAARTEEADLLNSDIADEYRSYMNTGSSNSENTPRVE